MTNTQIGALIAVFIGVVILVLGVISMINKTKAEEKLKQTRESLSASKIREKLETSNKADNLISFFSKTSNTELLLRKSGNPWNLTASLFNTIRIALLVGFLLMAIVAYLIGLTIMATLFLFFSIFGFFYPVIHYKNEADRRESQWMFIYQYMWVIKHNLSFFDVRKTFVETEEYIKKNNKNYDELINGFHDFADHWNGEYIDQYILDKYCDFSIPKELLQIMLTSSITGEFPEDELNSLRQTVINKADFNAKQVLSSTGTKATLYSSPMLLITIGLIVMVPTAMMVLESIA